MPGAENQRKHILVVNDDKAILQLFRDLLEDEGYCITLNQFSVATTELHQTITTVQPSLVILDFIIGGEGKGWQLLQTLKMDRATRQIPIIICTAAVRQVEEMSGHLREMGVEVVRKPFDIDHLIAVIDHQWGHHVRALTNEPASTG